LLKRVFLLLKGVFLLLKGVFVLLKEVFVLLKGVLFYCFKVTSHVYYHDYQKFTITTLIES